MFNDYHYLYVEDDALSREIMQTAMQDVMGVTTLNMFDNSADFMTKLRALPHPPDLILLDIQMQPYSGFELLSMLRNDPNYANKTVIALTASVMNAEVDKLKQSGFDGAIGKPLNVMVFPGLIERVLKGERIWQVI